MSRHQLVKYNVVVFWHVRYFLILRLKTNDIVKCFDSYRI